MNFEENDFENLVKTLTDNFNVLADEVQLLSDRKTVLEHKLRYAHEQYQRLADKYAPSDTEITDTLAKLQLPPDLRIQTPDRATFVPLPSRRPPGSKQQMAEAIRDGRRASQKISALRDWKHPSEFDARSGTRSITTGTDSILRPSHRGTSATTALEQDFTVPGKKSDLKCPLASLENISRFESSQRNPDIKDTTPHRSTDPICANLYAEAHSSQPPSVTGSAAKCPIRFLDQHSPEEVAKYFESHKHEIPRSHEVCVKRYQRNEEDIRKLDAKYGNLVSMISGLGQKHQPMLPMQDDERDVLTSNKMNERVQKWATAVSQDGDGEVDAETAAAETTEDDGEKRESRFDRPLKEVRVGESPSRPWGIAVPIIDPLPAPEINPPHPAHTTTRQPTDTSPPHQATRTTAGKCPFGHGTTSAKTTTQPAVEPPTTKPTTESPQATTKTTETPPPPPPIQNSTFINGTTNVTGWAGSGAPAQPQMVFTGPVFIGYPVEQAMALMQQWEGGGGGSGAV